MHTASLKVVVPIGLSPMIQMIEQKLRETLFELQMHESEGHFTPEQLAAASIATAMFECAVAEFAPVVAAYQGRAAMYEIPTTARMSAMVEEDIRDELDGLEMLFQQVQKASEEDRAEIEREQVLANERLAMRRKLLLELKERRESRLEMLNKTIGLSFEKDIAAYASSLRIYVESLNRLLPRAAVA